MTGHQKDCRCNLCHGREPVKVITLTYEEIKRAYEKALREAEDEA